MKRTAFKMQLHPGQAAEYRRRHDELWPDLAELLKVSGISNYAIFLEEGTNSLFGVMDVEDPAALDELPKHPLMRRWWVYMADIMDTNPDHSPVSSPLTQVFFLP